MFYYEDVDIMPSHTHVPIGTIDMMSWKLGPALAAGNTIVHKPAQNTALTALKVQKVAYAKLIQNRIFTFVQIGKMLSDCGLPPGVLNIVTGDGVVLEDHMTTHPRIDKIAFTGSTRVGKHIQKRTADTIKRVTLELGMEVYVCLCHYHTSLRGQVARDCVW